MKEKILAAHRGGVKKVVIPKENEKDLKDIPAKVLKEVEIVLVEHMDEVLPHALILDEGDKIFQEDDIPLEIMPKEIDQEQRPSLI
jgi:ATP-dependent Lon protease